MNYSGFHRGRMRSSIVLNVTRRRLVVSDVSGLPTGHIFKDQAVQEEWTS